jgi:hypothetical protein
MLTLVPLDPSIEGIHTIRAPVVGGTASVGAGRRGQAHTLRLPEGCINVSAYGVRLSSLRGDEPTGGVAGGPLPPTLVVRNCAHTGYVRVFVAGSYAACHFVDAGESHALNAGDVLDVAIYRCGGSVESSFRAATVFSVPPCLSSLLSERSRLAASYTRSPPPCSFPLQQPCSHARQ